MKNKVKINIKVLSVNKAWKGQRYKTNDYKVFETELWYKLPNMKVGEGKLRVEYTFGLSSKASDYDNCIKQTQDILSKKFNFNDNRIYEALIKKVDVAKGEEFIEFKIEDL